MRTPTLTISIDRTSLPGSLAPLVLDAANNTALRITGYVEPQRQARVTYMPDSRDLDGSQAVASSWQQALMFIDLRATGATEADLESLKSSLQNALGQFSYPVTVTANGVAETWSCDPGSLTPIGRQYVELRDFKADYTVTIPCYPIPGA